MPAFTLGIHGVWEGWVGAAPNGGAAGGVGNDQPLTEELSHELHMGGLSTPLAGTACTARGLKQQMMLGIERRCSAETADTGPKLSIFRDIGKFQRRKNAFEVWRDDLSTTYFTYLTYLFIVDICKWSSPRG